MRRTAAHFGTECEAGVLDQPLHDRPHLLLVTRERDGDPLARWSIGPLHHRRPIALSGKKHVDTHRELYFSKATFVSLEGMAAMTSRQMHLCGLLIAGPVVHSHALWRNPDRDTDFLGLEHYAHIARTLERGRFDFLFFADRLAIADRFGDGLDLGIRHGDQDATRMDPVPLLGAMAAVTQRIGLGATRSTTYGMPYHVAREFATLDHLSGGRAAWNVVTSMNDGEAMNFGVDSHMEHDERYDRADEFLEVTCGLWDSWDADALVLDKAAGVYADPAKVHYLNHSGKYFKARGPLNIPRSPQGRPVIIQAGSSGRGKQLAARWAEVIFTVQPTDELLKRFTADIRSGVAEAGRPPESCKVLSAVMPFVGASEAEAKEKQERHNALIHPLVGLSTLSAHANVDLSGFDLDAPVSEIKSRGSQGNIAAVTRIAKDQDLSLKQIGQIYGRSVMVPQIVGTPHQIADQFCALFEAEACNGFVLSPAFLPDTFEDFVDHVVPILQARNLVRTEYAGRTLRENLGAQAATASLAMTD
jgi:FMN-dependent oxidoreductase (nitrilotriacetate monooxygenase family)